MTRSALRLLLFAPSVAFGQSTSRLPGPEPTRQWSFAIGTDDPVFGKARTDGPLRAATATFRFPTAYGHNGVRLMTWFMTRDRADSSAFTSVSPGSQPRTYYNVTTERTRVLALVGAMDFPIWLSRDLAFYPMLGAGYAPLSQRVWEQREPTSSSRISDNKSDALVMTGVSLRWRHLVVEQDWFSSVRPPGTATVTSPLTVGWRF